MSGHSVTVLQTAHVRLVTTECDVRTASGPRELVGGEWFEVCLVRRGCFAFRDSRGRALVDGATCVLGSPWQSAEAAHPADGGDLHTVLLLSPALLHQVGAGSDRMPLSARVSPQAQLAHLQLLAVGRRGDDPFAGEEIAVRLTAGLLSQDSPRRTAAGRPSTESARRRLADEARMVLSAEPAVDSVVELASRLCCSPHHLSRVFHEQTGSTLAAYRTALRVNAVLERLADNDEERPTLAALAARYGFADHAHLTRSLRRHTGWTPSAVRDVLRC